MLCLRLCLEEEEAEVVTAEEQRKFSLLFVVHFPPNNPFFWKHVTSAPVAAAAAPAPVKMISPTQPQPIDNYSAPAPAPVAVSSPKAAALPTAIAQWDFNAETPEEVNDEILFA